MHCSCDDTKTGKHVKKSYHIWRNINQVVAAKSFTIMIKI